jgi:FMN phosphatase YigB (HAD superfamily)
VTADEPSGKPCIRLVVTDLDNTLYDWVSSFVPAVTAMIDAASEIVGVPAAQLAADLRRVHQDYGSSEHPFALLDAACVVAAFPNADVQARKDALQPAFAAFNDARRRSLRLYEGVAATISRLRAAGVPVVAYTDARLHNASYRVAMLGLVPLLARLYAPAHTVEPVRLGASPQYVQDIPADFIRMLPAEDRKPNPRALLDIVGDFGIPPNEALYVGDSLVRDVYMARRAGVHAAWARYGTQYDRSLWDALVSVSHWTPEDVRRESELRAEASDVEPDVELHRFADLLGAYDFGALDRTAAASP